MTHDPGKEDLAEKQLSQLYHALDAPEASNGTDEAILAFARQRTMTPDEEPNKPVINWMGGFSVAASIVLVSVLYWAQLTPENFSNIGSSSSKTPEIIAEQDDVAQHSVASVAALKEQNTMVTASRAAPSATAMASDSLRVDSPSEAVVAGSTIESSALIAEDQIETIALTGSRVEGIQEEHTGEQAIASTGSEVSVETDGSVPDVHIGAAQRQSLDNQLLNKLNGQFADPTNTSSSVLPDCNLSLHGGYKLASTPLAKFTVSWNDSEKVWLIKMLNDEIDFSDVTKFSSEGLSEEGLTILNKPNFADSYYTVVEQLQRCRENFGRAIQ